MAWPLRLESHKYTHKAPRARITPYSSAWVDRGRTDDDCALASGDGMGTASAAAWAPVRCASGALSVLLKRVKKSSAILRATPSIRRDPICASLPPTDALAV